MNSAASAKPSDLRRMIDVRCAAFTESALPGESSVTAPAPARAAASADSLAAPVEDGPPEKTADMAARIFVSIGRRSRKAASQFAGSFSTAERPDRESTSSRMPISATIDLAA